MDDQFFGLRLETRGMTVEDVRTERPWDRFGSRLRCLPAKLVAFALIAIAAIVVVPSASADPTSDPLTNPSCYLSSGCGASTSIPNIADGHTSLADGTVGALPYLLPQLGTGLEEIPLPEWVYGLQDISLETGAFGLGLLIGSAIDHMWLKGLVTDTEQSVNVCSNWRFQMWSGDPLNIGMQNATYLHAVCGPNSSDTWAASPHSSGVTDPAQYQFWHYVLTATTIHHGGLQAVASSNCDGSSPCYVWAATVASVAGITGPPLASNPGGTEVSTDWADPSTGKGTTKTANPYGSGPTDPNPQCLQGGVVIPCSSVDPNGPPVTPADGLPEPLGSDAFANGEANYLRCLLTPASFGCPQDDGEGEFSSSGGPLITMPNCYGLTEGDCEGAIDNALTDAGSSVSAAYSTTVAPTYDPNIGVGLVQATIVTAGTITDADSVTMEINEPQSDGNCWSQTMYPHTSTSRSSLGLVDAKGMVQCATAQTVTFTVQLWKCSSPPDVSAESDPDAVIAQLNAEEWGCDTSWTTPSTQDVVAYQWSGKVPAFADAGPDSTAYYIAATYGPGVDSSISQMISGSSMPVLLP